MKGSWSNKIRIGDLPAPIQMDLSNWCMENRKHDPVLTTVEQWPIHEIVRTWLEWQGIIGYTYQFLVLMDAITTTLTKEGDRSK